MESKLGVVALYAGRIRFWAMSVEQAHQFGTPEGTDDEPWEPAFQRKAAGVYRETLPASYLNTLVSMFLACSLTMEEQSIPAALSEDWHVVSRYLESATDAIAEEMDFDPFPMWADPSDSGEPTTPAVVRFDQLAAHTTRAGVKRLRVAGDNVSRYLLDITAKDSPLNDDQLAILGDLAEGVRVIDIAVERGFSSRSLYRELAAMWKQLGVDNKQQGIALAVEQGWLN